MLVINYLINCKTNKSPVGNLGDANVHLHRSQCGYEGFSQY